MAGLQGRRVLMPHAFRCFLWAPCPPEVVFRAYFLAVRWFSRNLPKQMPLVQVLPLVFFDDDWSNKPVEPLHQWS